MNPRSTWEQRIARIARRLHNPKIECTQNDRDRLADLLERLLRKWRIAEADNDTIAVVTWPEPNTISR